jgi:hypothetical protein
MNKPIKKNKHPFTEEENQRFSQIVNPPEFVCERIWSREALEKQARIDELIRLALPNELETIKQQTIFDAREAEYNRRLVNDGEKSAKEWLEQQKQTKVST